MKKITQIIIVEFYPSILKVLCIRALGSAKTYITVINDDRTHYVCQNKIKIKKKERSLFFDKPHLLV